MQTLTEAAGIPSAADRPHRRRREEIEALAAEFVGAAGSPMAATGRSSGIVVVAAAGAVATIAAAAWLLWPASSPVQGREAAVAPAGSEDWMRRLEAERERQRQESQRSHDYLQRMAAADAALLGEMTSRAGALAARSDPSAAAALEARPAAPAARAVEAPEPSPRGEQIVAATPPAFLPAPTPPPAVAAPAETVSAQPSPHDAPPAAQPAASARPAGPAPAQDGVDTKVASAPPASCRIHVSELTSSGTLTYADVARMKGARTEPSTGHVFTPPLKVSGRSVVFVVTPDGCVRVRDTR